MEITFFLTPCLSEKSVTKEQCIEILVGYAVVIKRTGGRKDQIKIGFFAPKKFPPSVWF